MTLGKLSLGFLFFEMGMMTTIHGQGEYLGERKCPIHGSLSLSLHLFLVIRHQQRFLHPPLHTCGLDLIPEGQ